MYRCVLHLSFAWVHVGLHVHVFGNYWLGGFEDRDPKPIRERDTAVLYSAISGHRTICIRVYTGHYTGIGHCTILYYIGARDSAAPGPGFSYMGHQLISAPRILLISISLILAGRILIFSILLISASLILAGRMLLILALQILLIFALCIQFILAGCILLISAPRKQLILVLRIILFRFHLGQSR